MFTAFTPLLAAIKAASPAPVGAMPAPAAGAVPAATPELIRDIAPPVDIFPYPVWLVVLVALVVVAALVAAGYWLHLASQRRPPTPPPSPRALALADLERLRAQVKTLASYEFSITVSHILRRFVETQFGVPALEQTSPEFLADIGQRSTFVPGHQTLLADFLGRCDAIKFGGEEGDETVNEALLRSATAFVQGGAL